MGFCRLFCSGDRLFAIYLGVISSTSAAEGKAALSIVCGYCFGGASIFAGMSDLPESSDTVSECKSAQMGDRRRWFSS